MHYTEYFSFRKIVEKTAKKRASSAIKTGSEAYFKQYEYPTSPDIDLPDIYNYFPSRKKWFRPKPKKNGVGRPYRQPDSIALRRTVFADRYIGTINKMHLQIIWIIPILVSKALKNMTCWQIRLAELHLKIFCFSYFPHFFNFKYKFVAIPKDSNSKEHRLICLSESLAQNILVSQLARYLRDFIDPVLKPSVYAFRPRGKNSPAPTHHDAFKVVHDFILQSENSMSPVYVSECDIQKFFDSINHTIIMDALDQIIKDGEIAQKKKFDRRAKLLILKFLASYTFPSAREIALKSKGSDALIPWIENTPVYQRASQKDKVNIGVPQGSALSCIIANIVLHRADISVEEVLRGRGVYARYCDDMIILANDPSVCQESYTAYVNSLENIGLPYHYPANYSQKKYDRSNFWNKSKSKSTYKLCKSSVPWTGFVGYQVRYDGTVRVRLKSVRAEMAQQAELLKSVYKRILVAKKINRPLDVISLSLHRRIVARSVGKKEKMLLNPNFTPTLCWVNGFKHLSSSNKKIRRWQRELDRSRFRKISAFRSRLNTLLSKGEISTDFSKWQKKQQLQQINCKQSGSKRRTAVKGILYSYDRI